MLRLGIVGCGLTGAVTASLLKQKLPHIQVVILEKSKGTGGRFCTSRGPLENSVVDLGAQFITKSSSISEIQKRCYSQLLENGLLQPLEEPIEGLKTSKGSENFICTQGSGSVVKYFLQIADCDIKFNHRVAKCFSKNNKWKIYCENKSEFEFDAVIMTMPVPQILQLDGVLSCIKEKELENLKSVVYSSRFAVGLFYDKNKSYFDNIPWTAKYIDGDVLRFCSLDHKKKKSSLMPSVAVHTTKEFGKMHIDDNDMSSVQKTILSNLEKILPGYPEPSFVKFHKWRYSQVENPYSGKPGYAVLSENPLLIAGGDGFSCSTFEGCIYSSENIVKNILLQVKY